MEPILVGIKREKLGKSFSNRSRKKGYIPAVVYMQKDNNFINLEYDQIKEVFKKHGENALIGLKIGDDTTTVMIKEIQKHPITKDILHIDFKPAGADDIINTKVPVNYVNTEWIKKQRGILQTQMNDIEIKCKAADMPKAINLDVSKHNVGDALRIKDVEIGAEISIVNNPEEIVATITRINDENI